MSATSDTPKRERPLRIAVTLPYERGFTRFSIRVENVAPGARLSIGVNNGDGTWSLAPDQLTDLRYLPADNDVAMRLLMVRVIGFKADAAETITAFSVLVAAADTADTADDDQGEETPALAPVASGMATGRRGDAEALIAARLVAARRQWRADAARACKASEARVTATVERELSAARARLQTAQALLVAAAVQRSERAMHQQLQDIRARFDDELNRRLAEAEDRWRTADATRLERARRQWEADREPSPPTDTEVIRGVVPRRQAWRGGALAAIAITAAVILLLLIAGGGDNRTPFAAPAAGVVGWSTIGLGTRSR